MKTKPLNPRIMDELSAWRDGLNQLYTYRILTSEEWFEHRISRTHTRLTLFILKQYGKRNSRFRLLKKIADILLKIGLFITQTIFAFLVICLFAIWLKGVLIK